MWIWMHPVRNVIVSIIHWLGTYRKTCQVSLGPLLWFHVWACMAIARLVKRWGLVFSRVSLHCSRQELSKQLHGFRCTGTASASMQNTQFPLISATIYSYVHAMHPSNLPWLHCLHEKLPGLSKAGRPGYEASWSCTFQTCTELQRRMQWYLYPVANLHTRQDNASRAFLLDSLSFLEAVGDNHGSYSLMCANVKVVRSC